MVLTVKDICKGAATPPNSRQEFLRRTLGGGWLRAGSGQRLAHSLASNGLWSRNGAVPGKGGTRFHQRVCRVLGTCSVQRCFLTVAVGLGTRPCRSPEGRGMEYEEAGRFKELVTGWCAVMSSLI